MMPGNLVLYIDQNKMMHDAMILEIDAADKTAKLKVYRTARPNLILENVQYGNLPGMWCNR